MTVYPSWNSSDRDGDVDELGLQLGLAVVEGLDLGKRLGVFLDEVADTL